MSSSCVIWNTTKNERRLLCCYHKNANANYISSDMILVNIGILKRTSQRDMYCIHKRNKREVIARLTYVIKFKPFLNVIHCWSLTYRNLSKKRNINVLFYSSWWMLTVDVLHNLVFFEVHEISRNTINLVVPPLPPTSHRTVTHTQISRHRSIYQ